MTPITRAANSIPPRIPQDFYRVSHGWTVLMIVHGYSLFLIPSLVSYYLHTTALLLPVKIALMLPLTVLSGIGLHTIGWAGHEALHLNLLKNRYAGFVLGIFASSILVGHWEVGFALSHWNHHRFTNDEKDPDARIFGRFRRFWPRLLFARSVAANTYCLTTIKVAFGADPDFEYQLPLRRGQLIALAWENLLMQIAAISAVVYLTWFFPRAMLICYWLPYLVMYAYASLRPYIEHAATEGGVPLDTRSRTSKLLTFLEFGNNFHLEHHLYPKVPCYRLARLHRYLSSLDYYKLNDIHIEPSFWRFLRHAFNDSQYDTHQGNESLDVFTLHQER